MADDDGPNNLIHFPRVGYTEPPAPPAETPDPALADVPFTAPADGSDDSPEPFAFASRPSPLDTLTALADPGLGSPFAGGSGPETAPAPAAQTVPATFRSEAAQPVAPRVGALSLAAILAVSVAAMRGIHSAIAGRRESREQREAVAKTAAAGKDSASGGGSKKQLQPGHEWGRKFLQRGPGSPSGHSGFGPGRSVRGGSGPYSGSGGGRRTAPAAKSPGSSGGGSGSGRGGRGGGSGSGGNGPGINSPRRSSQGGGPSLKKNARGPGSSGSGGSGGSGGGKGPGASGGGRRGPGGSGSGAAGGGSSPNRKRGPGGTGSGGSAGGAGGTRRRPGASGSGAGKTGAGSKGPGRGPGRGPGAGAGTGAAGSKGPGSVKGTGSGSKSGSKKSPRGTTGPSGILRKKPGTTTSGTGPKAKSRGPGKTGPGGSGATSPGKGGGRKGRAKSAKRGGSGLAGPLPKAPGGKSRKGKKVTLTPGVVHGTFAATDTYGCRCRKCRRFKREYDRKVSGAMKSAARGRTTLGEAIHETAEKRLKRRRKKLSPPVMTKVKVKKAKRKPGSKTTAAAGSTKPVGPTVNGPAGPAAKAPAKGGSWSTAKARARKRARMRTRPVPVAAPAPAGAGTTPPVPPKPTTPPATPATPATPAAVVTGAGATAAAAPGAGAVPGTGEPRVSPFEAVGMATAIPGPAGPITVERADSPGPAPATSAARLPAGTSTKENSVSTVPDLTRDSWLAMWGDGGIAGMAAEHQTEVTLDDTLDVLEDLTKQSFAAHETCKKMAARARQIRYDLDELAADLRSRHNVIGRLTGAAMARLAESMELLARKADEMSVKSLTAAELCETAESAMFDAYRPVQQATEDAGLAVPSARIHNEG
ncbi:hypothetical protein [Streptomyces aureoverticillatus]|uniref:hypothetical protein n=1 Tax=Streptomyces aureoverticillatus TaxID=66871 RepID=UPI0013DC1548|nr:hypothetical protein [Streptomyces aureoverticillatus]QIB49499.1 hypothetical protein G3H79_40730 [Streptomyces aureoverticillatus]